jgi:HAD superfamily hydrolase (TIGR01509 family)
VTPAVVLDCDGLLVDTKLAWSVAVASTFPGGVDEHVGSSVDQIVELYVRPGKRGGVAKRLAEALLAAVGEHARPMRGAVALLRHLEGRPHIVASNAPPDVVRQALAHLGEAARGVELVALVPPFRPKPAPDLHLEACRRIGAAPGASLAFEDSVIGATAARAAGLWVVGVGAEPDLAAHADIHLDNLEDERLVELLGSLPRRDRLEAGA